MAYHNNVNNAPKLGGIQLRNLHAKQCRVIYMEDGCYPTIYDKKRGRIRALCKELYIELRKTFDNNPELAYETEYIAGTGTKDRVSGFDQLSGQKWTAIDSDGFIQTDSEGQIFAYRTIQDILKTFYNGKFEKQMIGYSPKDNTFYNLSAGLRYLKSQGFQVKKCEETLNRFERWTDAMYQAVLLPVPNAEKRDPSKYERIQTSDSKSNTTFKHDFRASSLESTLKKLRLEETN